VDIEHIDHIVDMRRYQTMIESSFPSEAGGMLKNLEKAGNPWGMPSRMRTEWTKDLGFKVPVLGEDVEDASELDYLFWVGCAGSLDDKAQKTTKAVAELLTLPGCPTRSSARPRRAPVTRRGGWATSSCSRCSPSRTSRR